MKDEDRRKTRKEDWRLRFWRWLHMVSGEAHHARWMQIHYHDRKCPHCLRWFGMGGWGKRREIDDWHEGITCGACGRESRWFMGAMVPIYSPDDGTLPMVVAFPRAATATAKVSPAATAPSPGPGSPP